MNTRLLVSKVQLPMAFRVRKSERPPLIAGTRHQTACHVTWRCSVSPWRSALCRRWQVGLFRAAALLSCASPR